MTGCQATKSTKGYVPDQVQPADIQPSVDTRSTVVARLGSPSTTSAFDDSLWVYMSATREQLTYHRPKITSRKITAIKFDERDQVVDVLTYDLEAGQTINFVSRETPTRGRELGILEQLFGTIGRLPTNVLQDQRGPGQ
jgi:outer membrane protein assembly factor BamE (lipoprotein component of BamABCDE complex)